MIPFSLIIIDELSNIGFKEIDWHLVNNNTCTNTTFVGLVYK